MYSCRNFNNSLVQHWTENFRGDYLSRLTHWPLGDLDAILKLQFSILFYWLVSSHHPMVMPSDECHGTSPIISQHWFRYWLGAVRQQAINWANVDPDLCRLIASLSLNDFIFVGKMLGKVLKKTSHYLNQYWFISNMTQRTSISNSEMAHFVPYCQFDPREQT